MGVVSTENHAYVILLNDDLSAYFPIQSDALQAELVEGILSENLEFDIRNYGIYFTFLSMLKAHGMNPTQLVFSVEKKGDVTCSLDIVEENELGVKVSRVPFLLADAVVIGTLGKIPVVIYGVAGTEFVFKLDSTILKQNIFSTICEEIARSERISAINSGDYQE